MVIAYSQIKGFGLKKKAKFNSNCGIMAMLLLSLPVRINFIYHTTQTSNFVFERKCTKIQQSNHTKQFI